MRCPRSRARTHGLARAETGLPATDKLIGSQCVTQSNTLITLAHAGLDRLWVAAWVVLAAHSVAGRPVAGRRQGTGRFGAGGRRERTRGCLYSETPLAKLFFSRIQARS